MDLLTQTAVAMADILVLDEVVRDYRMAG